MSQFFTSGGQSIGASASASVLPVNIQDWLPLGQASLISLQSKGLSRIFSKTTVQKHQFFGSQFSLLVKYWEGPKRALATLLADSYWILLRTSDAVLAHSLLADSDRRGTSLLMPGFTFSAARMGWESEQGLTSFLSHRHNSDPLSTR